MRKIFLFLTVAFISGCHPTYKLNDVDTTAKVRFIVINSERKIEPVLIYTHSDNQCSDTQKVREISPVIPSPGGISKNKIDQGMIKNKEFEYDPKRYVEIMVDSSKRFHFSTVGAVMGGQCYLTMSFQPFLNQQYEVIYENTEKHCVVKITQIKEADGEYISIPEASIKQQQRPCRHFIN